MATYFQGNPEIQAPDGLQTLVLMNPGYVQFSDSLSPPPTNVLFFNPGAGNSLISHNLHHAPPSQFPHLAGIPLPVSLSPNSQESNHISALHGFIPGAKVNHWNPINSSDARESQRATQGLSLSLSSQRPGFGLLRAERESSSPAQHAASREGLRISGGSSSVSGYNNGVSGFNGVLLCSKYLKSAQDLLEEVVNVSTDEINYDSRKKPNGIKLPDESSVSATKDSSIGAEPAGKNGSEFSTGERQEIQMKKAKLICMLDEVEQRYRQYHHQMQTVISSFEQATGTGSGRIYTSLALRTISKQFRCLKDGITGQIRTANKSLGEEDGVGARIGSSRLKFVDHQLRQQRALQQLGMIHQNAWRPQRGLPDRSVSVLRAWLFEHFLHPYPKDSDKQILAKQTGLTKSQVSNWFINARVRLWKPMVEEMYREETKDQEQNDSAETMNTINENSISPRVAPPIKKLPASFSSKEDDSAITASKSAIGGNLRNSSGSSPKKPKKSEIKVAGDEKQSRDEYSFMMNQTNFLGGFGEYPIGQIGEYDNEQFTPRFTGNSVSLSLGLPHHNLGRRIDIGESNEFAGMNSSAPLPATGFDNIDFQNRKRFVTQLLPDFVA